MILKLAHDKEQAVYHSSMQDLQNSPSRARVRVEIIHYMTEHSKSRWEGKESLKSTGISRMNRDEKTQEGLAESFRKYRDIKDRKGLKRKIRDDQEDDEKKLVDRGAQSQKKNDEKAVNQDTRDVDDAAALFEWAVMVVMADATE